MRKESVQSTVQRQQRQHTQVGTYGRTHTRCHALLCYAMQRSRLFSANSTIASRESTNTGMPVVYHLGVHFLLKCQLQAQHVYKW